MWLRKVDDKGMCDVDGVQYLFTYNDSGERNVLDLYVSKRMVPKHYSAQRCIRWTMSTWRKVIKRTKLKR